MKSLRGSDPDAALHYLARLLEAGDLLTRHAGGMLCSASEDVGLAYPQAVPIVKACVDTALQLGLPEAQAARWPRPAVLLATAPKSNSACDGHRPPPWRTSAHGQDRRHPARSLQNVHADGAGLRARAGLSSIRTISPTTGCSSSICRTSWRATQLLRVRRQQDRAGRAALLGRD